MLFTLNSRSIHCISAVSQHGKYSLALRRVLAITKIEVGVNRHALLASHVLCAFQLKNNFGQKFCQV